MANSNIYIDPNVLSGSISSLTNDNNEIIETIDAIYKNIYQLLNDEVWKSPEKPVIMDELIPYLEKVKDIANTDFNNYIGILNKALNDYNDDNENLKSDTEKLETGT